MRDLWLEEFRALRLFVSDLGSDLVWAIDALERQRARIEREFYLACEAQERVRELYEPTRPGGLPWSDASAASAVREICATLRRIVSDVGWAAREHVERNAARYGAHRALIDAIEVEPRPGSAWRREDVLRALGQERALRRANDRTLPVEEQMRADRQARGLAASLARHCANAARVRARWEDLCDGVGESTDRAFLIFDAEPQAAGFEHITFAGGGPTVAAVGRNWRNANAVDFTAASTGNDFSQWGTGCKQSPLHEANGDCPTTPQPCQ